MHPTPRIFSVGFPLQVELLALADWMGYDRRDYDRRLLLYVQSLSGFARHIPTDERAALDCVAHVTHMTHSPHKPHHPRALPRLHTWYTAFCTHHPLAKGVHF